MDADGANCLHYFAHTRETNNQPVADVLRGATIDPALVTAPDNAGHPPLHYALEAGFPRVVERLLAMAEMQQVALVYDELEAVCTNRANREQLMRANVLATAQRTPRDSQGFRLDHHHENPAWNGKVNSVEPENK